ETGEDLLVACDKCNYAANVEQADNRIGDLRDRPLPPATEAITKVATPGKGSIEDVSAFLKLPPTRFVKTLIYLADGKAVAVLVRGDRQVNEIKLKRALGANELVMAGEAGVREVTGAPVGFAGPVGLKIPVYADFELRALADFVVGANEVDMHHRGVNLGRDFTPAAFGDYRQAAPGDPCARCEGGTLQSHRGIEVGQVFFLDRKYSVPMKATFLDADGHEKPMVMGCYGIGVTRIAAAAIEQNHDKDGIIWPTPIAPYEVTLLSLQGDDPALKAVCDKLYADLEAAGIEVLYDDRDERPGSKFKDADLIGIPLRVAVGKKGLAEGVVEVKARRASEVQKVKIDDAVAFVTERVRAERR
ncbi:MAG TPA: proline--tRNA ligase, partial [Polyangia bacterium]